MNCQVEHIKNVPEIVNREKVSYLLKSVNRPGRYVGNEIGSKNKDFKNSSVSIALAFPDLYEIGISNHGLKIIYNIVNSESNFIADRVYAPDKDYRQVLIDNDVPLYGLETFVSLKSFDIIAFSVQYELNHTTMLAMLDMAKIPIFSKNRSNNDPLIIAGGPSCFNPEPFADFVDAVVINDGEDVIIEIMKVIEYNKLSTIYDRNILLEELSNIDGVYVPALYNFNEDDNTLMPVKESIPAKIVKRFSNLNANKHPDLFPIPFVKTIHDRAVVEIRRGCARMCRFCQPCFVNLPVRERSHEEVKNLCYKTLDLTGYDEISLLSLSTSDYSGLENLALSLNNELADKEISISLPSQRADHFNPELARQLQAVRKSTLTFAPEAGSERLRRVINKNLSEDQIIHSIISAYEAGWNKIKLYFIIGLPEESYHDLDDIINLIKTIKKEANLIKAENKSINKPLEITCSLSIFIPKPFTPFQWFGQLHSDEINKRKSYLLNAAKQIKGVKLNFHDLFSSKLEALFSRGNRKLSILIYNAYNNGAYLDSWTEYFSRQLWLNSINESQIDIELLTTKHFLDYDILPWEIIDTGINKDWLLNHKNLALKEINSTPCEDNCTNCGVCVNLNVSPEYKSRKDLNLTFFNSQAKKSFDQKFKFRLKITKQGNLKFISHLDWFRLIYRASRRAKIPVAYSQGFNPSPKISIGIPLGLFIESTSEFMDIELLDNLNTESIKLRFNNVLPDNCQVLDVKSVDNKTPSLSSIAHWAEYEAVKEPYVSSGLDFDNINNQISALMAQNEIIITKKTKSKTRQINIKPLILSVNVGNDNTDKILFTLSCSNEAMIKPDEFLNLFSDCKDWSVKRIKLMDEDLKSL
ncbi:MAG: TIGR03960 family B12-binding radical SAM protein [Cyanobacteriota bacterium]